MKRFKLLNILLSCIARKNSLKSEFVLPKLKRATPNLSPGDELSCTWKHWNLCILLMQQEALVCSDTLCCWSAKKKQTKKNLKLLCNRFLMWRESHQRKKKMTHNVGRHRWPWKLFFFSAASWKPELTRAENIWVTRDQWPLTRNMHWDRNMLFLLSSQSRGCEITPEWWDRK